MLLKLLLRFGEKPTMKRLFEIANVEHSKDDINVIKETVLNQIVDGLQVIKNGSRFVVRLEVNGQMPLCFITSIMRVQSVMYQSTCSSMGI
jgi:hypothetical protein